MQSTKTGWIPKTAFRHVCTSNPTGRLTNGRIMTKAFALVAVSTVSVLWPLTAWSQQTRTLPPAPTTQSIVEESIHSAIDSILRDAIRGVVVDSVADIVRDAVGSSVKERVSQAIRDAVRQNARKRVERVPEK